VRFLPETYNRQDWPRLVAQTVNLIIDRLQQAVGSYSMSGNTTATDIVTTGVGVKVAGVTSAGSQILRFSNGENRLTYLAGRTRLFQVTAVGDAINGGNNHQYAFSFYKNGTKVPETEKVITADSAGRAGVFIIQGVIEFAEGDYVEVWAQDNTGTADVTVSHLNVIATPLI
jgi:hypothetical protein